MHDLLSNKYTDFNDMIKILIIIIILTGISCGAIGKNMKIDYKDAVNIANNFLKEKKFDIQKTEVAYSPENEEWNNYFLSNKLFIESNNELLRILVNKDYWAIHYIPKKTPEIIKGGGAWVFIGRAKGEVIAYFLEK